MHAWHHGIRIMKRQKTGYRELEHRIREMSDRIDELEKTVELLREVEAGFRRSEKHFRDLVEHSLTGISIIQNDRIVYRNPEQQRIFGKLPEGGSPHLFTHLHPDDVPKVKKFYAELLSGRDDNPGMVIRFLLPGGTACMPDTRWLHCRASLIEYEGSRAILLNMMDVTSARELERLRGVRDRMTSLGHVAAGIAHEIRNPLSGITIYLHALEKILAKGKDLAEALSVIEKIKTSSLRIDAVIKRVMDFSKPGEPKLALIDIRVPIEDALSLSSATLRTSDITVEKDLPDSLPKCLADPQLIEQVMLNLITNATEAMKELARPKRLTISATAKRGCLMVRVGDSGPGVPPAKRTKIFDPFYTTKTGSTGIGLSLSHRIISDHKGTLDVEESALGGAEFVIRLPLKKEHKRA
jgi:PAS domain S-box-containing protein